jgi:hypothetical protein
MNSFYSKVGRCSGARFFEQQKIKLLHASSALSIRASSILFFLRSNRQTQIVIAVADICALPRVLS